MGDCTGAVADPYRTYGCNGCPVTLESIMQESLVVYASTARYNGGGNVTLLYAMSMYVGIYYSSEMKGMFLFCKRN